MLLRIRDQLQLDRPLAYALATRVWQAVSGPITIVLLIRALTTPEQGVYYALISIVGIQVYFELGLLNILVSYSGHEYAALEEFGSEVNEKVTADPTWLRSAARMRDLIHASFRWFGIAAALFAISAVAFGWYTLSESKVAWQGPLLAIVPIAAITVALSPALSILEGAGRRDLIYRFRCVQKILGSVAVWVALAMGWKLWALVIATVVQAGMTAAIMFLFEARFFATFRKIPLQSSDFVWIRDVMPVQWRIALIGITFHFATQLFTIIVVMFHGDAAAAPLGMTISVTGAIQMLALAWVQTKFPVVAAHHGAGEREVAGTIWRQTAIVSTTLLIVASLAFAILIASFPLVHPGLERRFLPAWQIIVLCIGCVANHITSVQGFYVLSRRAKPLLGASLIGSLSTAAAVWIGGYFYSSAGVVIGYALTMTLLFLPIHTWAYYHFRQESQESRV